MFSSIEKAIVYPAPYFRNIPQLGNLTLDYIFVEDGYPILFTCRNGKKIYLCICRTVSPEQKWVISETSVEILGKMANREIPICEVFKSLCGRSCIARWSKDVPVEQYEVFPTSDLQWLDLPGENCYLCEDDAEDAVDYVEGLTLCC